MVVWNGSNVIQPNSIALHAPKIKIFLALEFWMVTTNPSTLCHITFSSINYNTQWGKLCFSHCVTSAITSVAVRRRSHTAAVCRCSLHSAVRKTNIMSRQCPIQFAYCILWCAHVACNNLVRNMTSTSVSKSWNKIWELLVLNFLVFCTWVG